MKVKSKKWFTKSFNEFNYKILELSDKELSELTNKSEDIVRKKEMLLKFYNSIKVMPALLNLNLIPHICTQLIKETSRRTK